MRRPSIAVTFRIAAAALLLLSAAACAPERPAGPEANELRAALYSVPQSLSLLGGRDRSSLIIARLVTDSLVNYDASLELRPRLAASWTVSPDGRTVTFTLRDGVRWHDGTPFTSRDVLFSVEKVKDPHTQNPSFGVQFEGVTVEAPDERTVRATYDEPFADFLEAWTVPIVPEHLAGHEERLLDSEFSRHPVGCGPFRFVRYEPDVEIVLEANPDYWDGRPFLDRLVIRIVPDERTALQALLRGDLDIIAAPPDIWEDALSSPEAAFLERLVYFRLTVWYVAWNQDGSNPFFTDPRTRRAMVLALDRERFLESILMGLGRVAVSTYHPESPWNDPSVKPWPYDPDEARRLLEEAGWADSDGDGVRERDGRPFAFTLTYPASRQETVDRIAAWIQQSLASVGVRMELERLEWRAFLDRRRAHQFEAVMAQFDFTPIPDQYEIYHSSARENGFNFFGLSDPEVDRLVEQGRVTFDPQARREIYNALQHRLHELEPISCLFHFASPVLHHPELEGIEPAPMDIWQTTPGPRAWRWAGQQEGG